MEIKDLEKSVRLSRYVVGITFIVVILGYMVNFMIVGGIGLSRETGAWGQFGDFVGGALNPLIAFFAFYWLSMSVIIQKQELSETKKALEAAAVAQEGSQKQTARTARINALNTLLQSVDSDVSNLRANIEFVNSQIGKGAVMLMSGASVGTTQATNHVAELNIALQRHLESRERLRDQIKAELQDGSA